MAIKKQPYLTSFCLSPFLVVSDNDNDPYLLSLFVDVLFPKLIFENLKSVQRELNEIKEKTATMHMYMQIYIYVSTVGLWTYPTPEEEAVSAPEIKQAPKLIITAPFKTDSY